MIVSNHGWGPGERFVGGCGDRLLVGLWDLGKATESTLGCLVGLGGGGPIVGGGLGSMCGNQKYAGWGGEGGLNFMRMEVWLHRHFRNTMEAGIRYTR